MSRHTMREPGRAETIAAPCSGLRLGPLAGRLTGANAHAVIATHPRFVSVDLMAMFLPPNALLLTAYMIKEAAA